MMVFLPIENVGRKIKNTTQPIDLDPDGCEFWTSAASDLGFVVVDMLLLDLISFKMDSSLLSISSLILVILSLLFLL